MILLSMISNCVVQDKTGHLEHSLDFLKDFSLKQIIYQLRSFDDAHSFWLCLMFHNQIEITE